MTNKRKVTTTSEDPRALRAKINGLNNQLHTWINFIRSLLVVFKFRIRYPTMISKNTRINLPIKACTLILGIIRYASKGVYLHVNIWVNLPKSMTLEWTSALGYVFGSLCDYFIIYICQCHISVIVIIIEYSDCY